MTNQRSTVQTANMRYLISLQQEDKTRQQLYKEIPDTNEPMIHTHKVARQMKYRRIRELSMSRDQPPRLPVRPWCDNGDEYLWTCPGKGETPYQQPRVDQRRIETPFNVPDTYVCYTCMDHRMCLGPICPPRVLSCYFCNSKEGPLRVRAKKLAKRVADRPKRFD